MTPPRDRLPVEGATLGVCGEQEIELRAGELHVSVGGEILVGEDSTGEIVSVAQERTAVGRRR